MVRRVRRRAPPRPGQAPGRGLSGQGSPVLRAIGSCVRPCSHGDDRARRGGGIVRSDRWSDVWTAGRNATRTGFHITPSPCGRLQCGRSAAWRRPLMANAPRLPHAQKGLLVHMNSVPALRAVVTAAVIAALAPSTAVASTWTVDDDKADCPNAAFTSIQAAVDQAAPWDTVVICPGLYLEQSTPTSGNNSPSQAGSRNGLTITKPLTLRGRGSEQGHDPPGERGDARRHRAVPARRRRKRRHGRAPVARRQRRQRELRRHLRGHDRVAATSPRRPESRSSTPRAGSPTA